ncbi:uncharacterized protein VP01_680g1 [Puccinia sorghi]|uniref:Integrase catalytic domain-containing protein n=1 Tax=Puccinia sorghi TaxID=27349 RepID=A0A0L6UGM9_9BASI|nr:uncharacterized protein VP01_680g1 [Puccinia sorghi]
MCKELRKDNYGRLKMLFPSVTVATGFSKAKLLASKDQEAQLLVNTIHCWERQTGHLVKAVHTDNGNLQDMGRTILIESQLGKFLWGFSFIWACDMLNLIPKKHSSITPYEAFHSDNPSFNHSNLFFKCSFVHVRAEGGQKLDEQAREGRVVAHHNDSKGWIFILKDTNQLVASEVAHWPEGKAVLHTTHPLVFPQLKAVTCCDTCHRLCLAAAQPARGDSFVSSVPPPHEYTWHSKLLALH